MGLVTERTVVTMTGTVRLLCSQRAHGDFHLERVARSVLENRRRSLVDLPWTMLTEPHGTGVVEVTEPGEQDRGEGDVLATSIHSAVLGIWGADCAPVVLVTASGRFVTAHAGWRGLAAGVLDTAVESLLGSHSTPQWTRAFLGPCIGPCCYAFGDSELHAVAVGTGLRAAQIQGVDRQGDRALDVPRAVTASLLRFGIETEWFGACTGCGGEFFSHRVGADPQRQVVAAWKQPR
jgi:copper oxidase (laccase) domain-containing protein